MTLLALAGTCVVGATGCSLSDLVGESKLPPNQLDPDALKTSAGALAAYQGAVLAFDGALAAKNPATDNGTTTSVRGVSASYVYVTGLLTDELSLVNDPNIVKAQNGFPTSPEAVIDDRSAPENDPSATGLANMQYYKDLFAWLQTVRTRSQEARGALRKYAPDQPPELIGHLYALEGYSDVLLAELFCSGIPLSTLVFEGDFQYTRGFTTEEVYQHALAQFDSALALAGDSANIKTFATMGRARALMGLNDYAGAAQAVSGIPTSYQYLLTYSSTRVNMFTAGFSTLVAYPATESNMEGTNGIAYWSDPRSDTIRVAAPASPALSDFRFQPRKFLPPGSLATPVTVGGVTYTKYQNAGTASIPIATGIEARLIEAEAALRAGGDWLGILNTLRTTCASAATCPTPAPAGAGGVAGLPPLTDPGSDSGRVSLLFHERAEWLYLTGYRQGDLRRLVRQYNRPQEQVYPIGAWGPLGVTPYGTDVNAPTPIDEQQLNPLYGGCINRDA